MINVETVFNIKTCASKRVTIAGGAYKSQTLPSRILSKNGLACIFRQLCVTLLCLFLDENKISTYTRPVCLADKVIGISLDDSPGAKVDGLLCRLSGNEIRAI